MKLNPNKIVWVSNEGHQIDADNNCFDRLGTFIFNMSQLSIDKIASGQKFGGVCWKFIDNSVQENE